ncbi:MAG: hypothetical protein KJ017_11255 [Alphaproteobacteria bacterium]|nr:hypothetical protein [Alphaproteobacteria bacterium]
MTAATEHTNAESQRTVWVAFTGQTELPCLRLLKPGFRHCFAIIREEGNWIALDPLANRMDVSVHSAANGFDMPRWLRSRGLTVIEARTENHARPAPLMPLTCVEAVKRILGLRARLIFTPWQLYRHLHTQACRPETRRALFESLQQMQQNQTKGTLSWEV